jgi:undecaprenyl diphosphate synthase
MNSFETPSAPAVPRHLGIILDGNRRWAREHGKSLYEGHKQGYLNMETISQAAFERGVQYVSAYAFSTENWNRSTDEVRQLMRLFLWIFKHEIKNLMRHGIRVRVLGSKLHLGKALVRAIHEAEEQTRHNQKGTLLVCLNYGGQQEIIDTMKQLVAEGTPAHALTADLISAKLEESGIPPIDLIIRTSGEQRLSNFMLWEAAYSEFMFTPTKWPDFSVAELDDMLAAYATRSRRFGK